MIKSPLHWWKSLNDKEELYTSGIYNPILAKFTLETRHLHIDNITIQIQIEALHHIQSDNLLTNGAHTLIVCRGVSALPSKSPPFRYLPFVKTAIP